MLCFVFVFVGGGGGGVVFHGQESVIFLLVYSITYQMTPKSTGKLEAHPFH